ncbi:hypothetical protein I6F11_17565 [Ensifer sp. NBAIM29]|nr:hypothetical protein [Ensifer sp. NBAIM29]
MRTAVSLARPLADGSDTSVAIPFFYDLPEAAIPSAAKLWDRARAEDYNGQAAYQDFAQDLYFLGIETPPRSIVKRWVAGVQAGMIERPGPVSSACMPEATPKASPARAKAERPRATAEACTPPQDASRDDIEAFASRLFDNALAELQRDLRAQAAKIVASQLRVIADRYDAAA